MFLLLSIFSVFSVLFSRVLSSYKCDVKIILPIFVAFVVVGSVRFVSSTLTTQNKYEHEMTPWI